MLAADNLTSKNIQCYVFDKTLLSVISYPRKDGIDVTLIVRDNSGRYGLPGLCLCLYLYFYMYPYLYLYLCPWPSVDWSLRDGRYVWRTQLNLFPSEFVNPPDPAAEPMVLPSPLPIQYQILLPLPPPNFLFFSVC